MVYDMRGWPNKRNPKTKPRPREIARSETKIDMTESQRNQVLVYYLTHGYLAKVIEGRQHNGGGIGKHDSWALAH
jgi:hypothetical protein